MGIRSIAALAAGIVLAAGVAAPASATIVVGTFAGTIWDSFDTTDTFGAGTGPDALLGQGISGTFSYEFEQVPPDFCGPGYGCYGDYNGVNWLQISVMINGATYTVPVAGSHFQGLYNYAKATAGYDYFQVYEDDTVDVFAGAEETNTFNRLKTSFYDYSTEFAAGDSVPTSATWTNTGFGGGGGTYSTLTTIYDLDAGTDTTPTYSAAS